MPRFKATVEVELNAPDADSVDDMIHQAIEPDGSFRASAEASVCTTDVRAVKTANGAS
jgi:hypothetical protein